MYHLSILPKLKFYNFVHWRYLDWKHETLTLHTNQPKSHFKRFLISFAYFLQIPDLSNEGFSNARHILSLNELLSVQSSLTALFHWSNKSESKSLELVSSPAMSNEHCQSFPFQRLARSRCRDTNTSRLRRSRTSYFIIARSRWKMKNILLSDCFNVACV